MKQPYYYYVPYIPVVGILLTFYYHIKFGDTCLEPLAGKHFILSGLTQAISGVAFIYSPLNLKTK